MRFTVEIACDNDAFVEDGMTEVARILKDVARLANEDGRVIDNRSRFHQFLYDINGNKVGLARLTK